MEENNDQNSGKFDPRAIFEGIKTTGAALHRETEKLNSGLSGIDKKLKETESLIDKSLQELKYSVSDIRINVSPEDIKKMESYKDYFKHYKPVFYGSLFILLCCLGLSAFGAYSGMKYYKESVRTKEEVRTQVLQEIQSSGGIIVEKKKWEEYQEQNRVILDWQKKNPKDSESLDIFIQGYKTGKK